MVVLFDSAVCDSAGGIQAKKEYGEGNLTVIKTMRRSAREPHVSHAVGLSECRMRPWCGERLDDLVKEGGLDVGRRHWRMAMPVSLEEARRAKMAPNQPSTCSIRAVTKMA